VTEIRFYHLTRTPLDHALPQILEKVVARGQRAVVVAGSEERVEALNARLWVYDDRSFLPHGSRRDGNAEHQPIWLTAVDENPNGATVLILTDGATADSGRGWELVCEFFDGRDDDAVAGARERWKAYRAGGYVPTYWRQADTGAWQKMGDG